MEDYSSHGNKKFIHSFFEGIKDFHRIYDIDRNNEEGGIYFISKILGFMGSLSTYVASMIYFSNTNQDEKILLPILVFGLANSASSFNRFLRELPRNLETKIYEEWQLERDKRYREIGEY